MSGLYAMDVTALEDERRYARCWEQVPLSRRQRIEHLRQKEDRWRSLGAGWLLQEVLFRYFGLKSPCLDSLPGGKPVVKDRPYIQFSLTHTGKWAVCAADICAIGADAETIQGDRMGIAGRFFTAEEQKSLLSLPSQEERDRAFTCIWTRKEAFLKYTGEGLRRSLASFSPVCPDTDTVPIWDPALCCYFTAYTLPDGTPLSLCTQSNCVPASIAFLQAEGGTQGK